MRKRILRIGVMFVCALSFFGLCLCGCSTQTQETPEKQAEVTPDKGETEEDIQEKDLQKSNHIEESNTEEDHIEEIRQRGYLLAGCKMDVPDLSFYDEQTDTWSGLEVELAYQTAANVFEVSIDEAKEQQLVRFIGVTVADREEKLEQKEVDCLFATYTITKERKQKFAFSDSYYTDYIGLMVKTSGTDANSLGTSDIRSIADLDGKRIGVAKNATTRKTFLNYMDTMNNIKTAPIFFEYHSYEALFSALKDGTIDVMAVDVSILNGYTDKNTTILNDRFGGQHYGAAVRKENEKLLEYVNEAIRPDEF